MFKRPAHSKKVSQMNELSTRTEIALHLAYNLACANHMQELFTPFVSFVCQYEKGFEADYESASHLIRHSTGRLEKKLVTMLIEMSSYQCTTANCQTASTVMVLLGYESYQLKPNRFRQKVENYLRQMRRNGGQVPPSTRSMAPTRGMSVKTTTVMQRSQTASDMEYSKESFDTESDESKKTEDMTSKKALTYGSDPVAAVTNTSL